MVFSGTYWWFNVTAPLKRLGPWAGLQCSQWVGVWEQDSLSLSYFGPPDPCPWGGGPFSIYSPQQEEGRLSSGNLTLGPHKVTSLHTSSPRRHMSRSVGTQMTLSRPSSILASTANRNRWKRCVRPLRPYAVTQNWGTVGKAGKVCCRHPPPNPGKLCIWKMLVAYPSEPHILILESRGMN